ncbi:MAG: protein translocase subunit SecD [Betaproteobacteria bacterium]|nr:protein translocase subunit SecD [Betaproteobacteria bacterium]
MNKYPPWKYAIIALTLVIGFLFAVPNLFGEAPAIQVSGLRANKADDAIRKQIEETLKVANIRHESILVDDNSIKVRFPDTDTQLKARDAVQAKVGPGYVVALNLVSDSPAWLTAIGAKPMYLGLDLRGGVHFLLSVDMKAVMDKAVDRYNGEIRNLLREKKIYYSGLAREGDKVVVRFKDKALRDQADKLLVSQVPDLNLRDTSAGEDFQITATIKPEAATRTRDSALQQNITTLRNRVNELGVSEPIVQQSGPDRILVQLAGVQDTARAKDIIGRTASLEVRMVAEELASSPGLDAFEAYKSQSAPFGTIKLTDDRGATVLVRNSLVITGERVIDAQPNFDQQSGGPIVTVRLDAAGGRVMTQTTRENVKKRMAMILVEKGKSEVLTWPSINGEFGSNFIITGMPSVEESKNLALLLRAGSLAAPMEIIEERTIGPSLGAENIKMGQNAVIGGFIAIAVFMCAYYMLFGLVSVLALGANLLFLVALLSMMQATLTLPGIAAIALTLGMAIDANVLINERIREEVRAGMSPQMAIQAGYDRAFDTILDSNITTLIAGLALLVWGSGPVRGFAVVHCLGILTSIFSAVVVSRGLVNLIYGGKKKVAKLSIGDTSWQQKAAA